MATGLDYDFILFDSWLALFAIPVDNFCGENLINQFIHTVRSQFVFYEWLSLLSLKKVILLFGMCEHKFRQWAQYSEHCHRKLLSILLYSYFFTVDDVKLRRNLTKRIINPFHLPHSKNKRTENLVNFLLSHNFSQEMVLFSSFRK